MSQVQPDRAVAVVIRDGRVLVIDRYLKQDAAVDCVMCEHRLDLRDGMCPGHRYTVLPGGGVEEGESPHESAERELLEESTMVGASGRSLWVGEHNGRRAFYVEMVGVVGEAKFSGPELEEHSPDNSFAFAWLESSELEDRCMHPPEVSQRLSETCCFGGG